jgi:hypothetical protein
VSESVHMNGTNWVTYEQLKTEIESALRCKISEDITKFADICRQRGMNGHFTSALDLAADIALLGPKKMKDENGDEVIF